MRDFTKRIVAGMACVIAFSAIGSTAMAESQSTTMTYNNKLVTCTLDVDWNLFGSDYGKAKTSWSYDNQINQVWVYLIGDVNSKADSGYVFAEVNVAEESVWDFNSTHKLLHGDGTTALVSRTLSDW